MESKYQTNLTEIYASHQEAKYEIFNDWCQQNGVIMPKLDYPATFDGGLLGVRASADIKHREAFLYVPFKMLITLEYARKHSALGEVIRENPQLFHADKHDDWEQLTLALAMLYEYQQGTSSFWFPYLNLLPLDIEFFCNWLPEDLKATDDPDLEFEAFAYRRDIEKEWQDMKSVLMTYPEYFSHELLDRQLFMRIFAQVCSRCFGWGLPTTAMIPMADNCNHSHGTCVNETINKDFQSDYLPLKPNFGNVPRKYFTREKFMNDYSAAFTSEQVEASTVNITGGRFSRDNFNHNIEKYSIETLRREIEEQVPLWKMTFKYDDFDEDNDTSEEEESEEEVEGVELIKDIEATKESGRLTQLINPRKGFKFFIEQEEKLLESIAKK